MKDISDLEKLTVIMELDDVLCHVFYPDEDEGYFKQPLKKFDFCVHYKQYDTYLNIYKRDNLDQFLKYLRENTEPVLYTTGEKSYVDLVMDLIDPERTFKQRIY